MITSWCQSRFPVADEVERAQIVYMYWYISTYMYVCRQVNIYVYIHTYIYVNIYK